MAIDHDANLVSKQDACPACGERDADRLVWVEDDTVECQQCGRRYDPTPEKGGGHDDAKPEQDG